ncbi:MAG: replicative DNA helicase, partial [Rhodospirillales bacterium]|nr:replicative DNA helicase [Rhodospirillales bacterium]
MNEMQRIEHPLLGARLMVPPNDVQAEQALLGALLANSGRVYDMVCDFLEPHHFADPMHGTIYDAIARKARAGEIADPITLRRDLENTGLLDAVGGTAYLAQLLSAMVGIINAKDYGRLVHDAWIRRQLINVCCETVDRCFTPQDGETGQDLVEALDGGLTKIAEGAGETKPLLSAAEAVSHALDSSLEAGGRESPLAGITTGYDALDRMTGGFMPG